MLETILQVGLWIIVGFLALGLIIGVTAFIFFLKVAHTISKTDHGYYNNDVLKGEDDES